MNAVAIPGSEEFEVLSPTCIEIIQLIFEFMHFLKPKHRNVYGKQLVYSLNRLIVIWRLAVHTRRSHTIFQAELTAIQQDLLWNPTKLARRRSKSILKSLQKVQPQNNLTVEIRQLVDVPVSLYWLKAQIGNTGKGVADRPTKTSSEKADLDKDLRIP
ncbi:hypothetical protein AVEN_235243-1 [Araneus ventricosus]|uniref:Uncharacterized protein n=1 Tax=Araneus ventricosus TaxID=182803 RepID=A0A4Y2A387_ARAVE|nr:hypothetical protein AVEN_235243-1 [Araneus ventricosus]